MKCTHCKQSYSSHDVQGANAEWTVLKGRTDFSKVLCPWCAYPQGDEEVPPIRMTNEPNTPQESGGELIQDVFDRYRDCDWTRPFKEGEYMVAISLAQREMREATIRNERTRIKAIVEEMRRQADKGFMDYPNVTDDSRRATCDELLRRLEGDGGE